MLMLPFRISTTPGFLWRVFMTKKNNCEKEKQRSYKSMARKFGGNRELDKNRILKKDVGAVERREVSFKQS